MKAKKRTTRHINIDDIKDRICETIDELDGDDVADVYNYIRDDKIQYSGDSLWKPKSKKRISCKSDVDQNTKKKIIEAISWYEYRVSGKSGLNGGDAKFEPTDIEERDGYIIATGRVTLSDCFDGYKQEIFDECKYYLDDKDFHLLTKAEAKEKGIK